MKFLIAVVTCHTMRDRAQAIRDTWAPNVDRSRADLFFFVGRPDVTKCWEVPSDVIVLDCGDGYRDLPEKTKAIAKWAIDHDYEWVFKCDDDTYVAADRLHQADSSQRGDYVGRKRGPSGGYPAPYASGFSVWFSRRALKILSEAPMNGDVAEDRWTGNTLLRAGIQCAADYRYAIIRSSRNTPSYFEGPRAGNLIISSGEYQPEEMKAAHYEYLNVRSKTVDKASMKIPAIAAAKTFDRVSVLVKTFLRDGYLLRTVRGLEQNLPGAEIVVVDDGCESSFKIGWYSQLRQAGHLTLWLPFDSGFGAKANAGVKAATRPFVLVASDDFNFDDPAVADGIKKLITVLEADPTMSWASGRVNGNPYEATLELGDGFCKETAGYHEVKKTFHVEYKPTDLTVNFTLFRREIFEKILWDEDVKIGGGEHGAFFIDLKRAGLAGCYVTGVNVDELRGSTDWQDSRYPAMRGRARSEGRPCLKRRGIDTYYLMGGLCEKT